MQTITVNLLKATKNTSRKLSVQFKGIRDSRLYQPFDRTPEVAAQQFAASLLSNALSAANLGGLIVGELVSSEATNAEYGARIVHRFVFKVLTVAPSVQTKAEAYAIHSAALEAAYAIRDLARAQAEIEYRKHDQIMNQAIDAANEALASNAA